MKAVRSLVRSTLGALAVAGTVALMPATGAVAQTSPIGANRQVFWDAYRTLFVDGTGRVIDNANGNISHSEGQGYGLLLSYLFNDPGTFQRIWSFTRTQLYIRDDGLAAWRWDPNANPRITDINNATDGDLLIAYALALAGAAWNDEGLVDAAVEIATAIGDHAIISVDGRTVMLPGVMGFTANDRDDGPVVNLSYWVFETLPVMKDLAPDIPWDALRDSGLQMLAQSRTGPAQLPPEWTALGSGRPQPAAGFDRVFGYNAIRIPLYLMRAGLASQDRLAPFLANRNPDGSSSVVHLDNGAKLDPLVDQGYRLVLAGAACAVNGTPVPDDLKSFQPSLYYSATLYLLAWLYLADNRPECL